MTNDYLWRVYLSNSFILSMLPAPCWVCGTLTRYIEIGFEAPTCPGICDWAATEAYFMALRDRDPWKDPQLASV